MFQRSLQLAALIALAVRARAECTATRATMQDSADTFLASQAMGMSVHLPYMPNFTYWENDKQIDIKNGIINKHITLAFNRSIIDTTACASFIEIIVADEKNQYQIGTQIRYEPNGRYINKIETMLTKPGDWFFNATNALNYARSETWAPIPEAKRDTRAVIKAAGDAYLDRFGSNKTVVPWGLPCARLEGGRYFGGNKPTDTCDIGMPAAGGLPMWNRRYVIDEVMGVVDIFVSFGGTETRPGSPDTHEFRVEGGKIRYVHTMTAQGSNSTRTA